MKRITTGRGVDVVYDAVGLDTYIRSMDSLRPRGLLALYGEASGLVPRSTKAPPQSCGAT